MLFKKSRRKNITVYKALKNSRWMSHITPLQTPQETREYIIIWEAVGQTQPNESIEDSIRW